MYYVFTKNVVIPVILLFANSKNCLGVRICSQAANLFKVPRTPSQAGKPENLRESFYPEEKSSLGSASLEPIATVRYISKANIIK